jgi:hypothetical protein
MSVLTGKRQRDNINMSMNKPQARVRQNLPIIKHVPTWVFLVLFLASSFVSIYALRQNNLNMVKLRSAVYDADKNNGDVNTALNNLRKYVYGHMNTNLSSGGNAIKPPIQLKYTYERLQAKAQSQANANNSSLYTEAENYCQAQIPANLSFSGRARVPCVQDYVSTHGSSATSVPAALYKFDFVSPAWSPDLAGWSLVMSGILLMLFIASFIIDKLIASKLNPL